MSHRIRFAAWGAGMVLLLCGCRDRTQPGGGPGTPAMPATSAPTAAQPADAPATCRRNAVADPSELKIAVVPMGSTHEFWKSIHAGAVKAELELKGVQVIFKGPIKENDREGQANVVENFINAGVTGIALAPADNQALVKPVREAVRAGIGVVVMDSGLNADVCTDYASFVATDNYAGGRKGARRLAQMLKGKGKVIMLRCELGFASTAQREQGFLDAIAGEFPDIQVVSSDQRGGATATEAQNRADSLLQRFQDVDGIFCPNESTTFGMLRSLETAGRAGKVIFVGFDSSARTVEALASGHIHGLVVQDPINIGYTAVKTLVAYLRGEAVPSRIDTGSEVATPENMNEPRIRELLAPPIEKYLGRSES